MLTKKVLAGGVIGGIVSGLTCFTLVTIADWWSMRSWKKSQPTKKG